MDNYRTIARQYANEFGIPVDLFMRQIQAESAWNPAAVSPAGAIGFGQLMPATAQELGVDIMNPQQNLYGAAKYLRQMHDRFGDWRLALAAYNAGPGRVEQYGGIPPFKETQNYVSSILDERDVRGGPRMSTSNSPQSIADDAMSALGMRGREMPQQQPMGLLEQLGIQKMGSGGPQGDVPFYQRDRFKDTAGALALALNDMQLRPGQGVAQNVAMGRQRRDANRTAQWLAQQPGGAEFVQMLEAGADPAQVLMAYRQSRQPAEATAMQKNYDFLIAQGYSPEKALQAVQGGNVTNISTGTIPPGYQLITDPETGAQRMEAIPGGPAAAQLAERAEAEANAAELAAKGESTVNRSVDFLIKAIDKKGLFDFPEAGVAGNLLAYLGVNQEAVDFRNELASLQAVIAFDRLQEMRNASKTGGALGGVSEKELTLLINAYGNLMQSTSSERLKENLETIRSVMNKIEKDPVASAMYYGTAQVSGGSGSGFSITGQVGG